MSDEKEIRKAGDYIIKHSIQIGEKEIVVGENMNDKDGRFYLVSNFESNEIFERFTEGLVGNDYLEIMSIFANRIKNEIGRLKEEMKDYPSDIITPDMCESIGNEDFINKIIVIKADYLRPEYRNSGCQIVQCTGGNGAKADGLGTSVFCKDFFDGEQCKYRRAGVIGILKPEHYPEWLKEKLALIETIKNNPSAFEYGGVHFVPLGIVKDSFANISKNLETDRRLGMWNVNNTNHNAICKVNYHYKDFYEACGNIKCDVFKCLENGKNYLPGENEMFLYNGKFKDYDTNKVKTKKHEEVER